VTDADEVRRLRSIVRNRGYPQVGFEETDDGYACEAHRPDEPHLGAPRGAGATKLEALRDLVDRLPAD
jgi:hypothetical protein